MKKSLIALAAFGALVGAASAQSSVTLYGRVDAGFALKKGTGESTERTMESGLTGSRWGLKGSEDLGGGLKAIFQLENGFSPDNGQAGQGGKMFGRQAFVGLSGGFGTVTFGRQYTPFSNAIAGCNIWDAVNCANGFTFDNRFDNSIAYTSPSLMGAEVQLYASMGEQPEQANDSHYGASVSYTIAGLNVVGAYHQFRHGVGGLKRAGLVNVGYDFGAANVVAHYTAEGNGANGRHKTYGVDVTVPMGAVTLDGTFGFDRNYEYAGEKFKVASVQATYALSKRTKFYTNYTREMHDQFKYNILRAGVRHDF